MSQVKDILFCTTENGVKLGAQVLVDDGDRLYLKVAAVYYDDAYDALIIDCADTRVEELKESRQIPRR